jgi:hypothetical protein
VPSTRTTRAAGDPTEEEERRPSRFDFGPAPAWTDAAAEERALWLFNAPGAGSASGGLFGFPSGVFVPLEAAERWIAGRGLSGALTRCPVDIGGFSSSRQERRYYDHGDLSAC